MSDSLMLETTGRGEDRLKEALRLAPVDRVNHVSWLGDCLLLASEFDDAKPQKMHLVMSMSYLVVRREPSGRGSDSIVMANAGQVASHSLHAMQRSSPVG